MKYIQVNPKFIPFIKDSVLKGLKFTNGHPLRTPWSGVGHVFCLHRVIESPKMLSEFNSILEISVQTLERHIQYLLKNKYQIVSSLQIPALLATGGEYEKFVSFTFDDGYLDNYELAFPLFLKYGIPFDIFVSTGFPDKTIIIWWYLLQEVIHGNNELCFTYEDKAYRFKTKTQTEKSTAFNEIRRFIIDSTIDVQPLKIKAVFKSYISNIYEINDKLCMNWNQIIELSRSPIVSIGAHTVNHYSLKALTNVDAKYEIEESKKRIENKINKNIDLFAYPFGSENEVSRANIDLVRGLGFKMAVTTCCGNIYPEHENCLYELPRLFMSEHINRFALNVRLNGVYPMITNNFQKIIRL